MYLSSSEPTPLKLDARTKEKERNVTVRPTTTTTTTTRLLRIAHSFVTSNAQTTFLLNQHKPPQKNLLSPQALAVAELRIAIHGSADESEAAIELLRRLRGQDAVELIGAGPRDAPDRRQFRLRARRRDAIGRSGAGPVRELELAADLLRGARRRSRKGLFALSACKPLKLLWTLVSFLLLIINSNYASYYAKCHFNSLIFLFLFFHIVQNELIRA